MIRTHVTYIPANTDVNTEFPRWIIQNCAHTSMVLDVGAGNGMTGHAKIIKQNVARLVGIDPDDKIKVHPCLDERFQVAVEDFANGHGHDFDCLYTRYVLEHVDNPREFLSACRSLLKPGGMLFGVTPNLWHYFGMATKLSASLGIEDWLLTRLIGTRTKNSYHFPTKYRLNSMRVLKRTLEQVGFREVEFVYFDPPRNFTYCFPKGLRWFPGLYSRFVYALKLPWFMGLIMFKAIA
jgi:2-polyprenyl-3-methyl-5-hydroxy-6-metoxy-1,4-benzoquinol methylase